MEQISLLFEELKGLESISKIYLDSKKEINALANEIESLKREKNSIDIQSIDNEIRDAENELETVLKEIECSRLLSNVCLSVGELEKLFEEVSDEPTCLEKSIEFMKNLVVGFTLSSQAVSTLFHVLDEEDFYSVVRIDKDIERLLELIKEREFYKSALSEFRNMMRLELRDTVPFDLQLFTTKKYIFIVFPSNEDGIVQDQLFVENPTRSSFGDLFSDFTLAISCIILMLKDNLSKAIIQDNYSPVDIVENNRKLENTDFYIKNVDEWIIDVVMKHVISVSKKKRVSSEIVSMGDPVTGKCVSEDYFLILRCLRFIEESASKRREKAADVFNRSILKFFSLGNCTTTRDYFVMYSDLTHFIKKHRDFVYSEDLSKVREETFYKILDASTVVDFDLSLSALMLKAKVKQLQLEFEENVSDFISEQTQKFFKIQFFERLYDTFISFVLKPRKHSENEKNIVKELGKYLLDISYGIESECIFNFRKIASICEMLGSSMDQVKSLYSSGDVGLEKAELRTFIRIYFDSSPRRDQFLDDLM